MYCSLIEAHNSPLKRQIEKYENRLNNTMMFYNSQGELESLDDVQSFNSLDDTYNYDSINNNNNDDDNESLTQSYGANKKYNKKRKAEPTHEEYLRSIIGDLKGYEVPNLVDAYDHLKFCRYCKNEFFLRIKGENEKPFQEIDLMPNADKFHSLKQNTFGITHDIDKTVLLSIILGIVVIFILQLFMKVFRSTQ